jgi:SAM-dependent methyltransferase
LTSRLTESQAPLGAEQLAAAVAGARSVLDAGCGSGRLTVMLAVAGAAVTGLDTSGPRLAQLREKAAAVAVEIEVVLADMDDPLPFADGAFAAAVSRLSLQIAREPLATLREIARAVEPGAPVATAVWADPARNPWFCEPRAAVAAALGSDRAAFARVFGRLGNLDELEQLHRDAGLADVRGQTLADPVRPASAADHWDELAGSIGHFRRLRESLTAVEAEAMAGELERRLEPFRRGDVLELERTMLVVTARKPGPD